MRRCSMAHKGCKRCEKVWPVLEKVTGYLMPKMALGYMSAADQQLMEDFLRTVREAQD